MSKTYRATPDGREHGHRTGGKKVETRNQRHVERERDERLKWYIERERNRRASAKGQDARGGESFAEVGSEEIDRIHGNGDCL